MNKFSLAPWRIEKPMIAALEIINNDRRIARVLYHMGSEDNQVIHNARLIAVAPDMLHELMTVHQDLKNFGNGFLTGEASTIALNSANRVAKLINKALGK